MKIHGIGIDVVEVERIGSSRGIAEVKISLTHARHYAAANAVALGE